MPTHPPKRSPEKYAWATTAPPFPMATAGCFSPPKACWPPSSPRTRGLPAIRRSWSISATSLQWAAGRWPSSMSSGLPASIALAPFWDGLSAASSAYGVPIVGGHTTIHQGDAAFLAAAVLNRPNSPASFDARPGDDLLVAVDLRGNWRGDKPLWNASVDAPPDRLLTDLALLPQLAENGWCRAGKDISNGGIVGTLAMLLECSRAGAELRLDPASAAGGRGFHPLADRLSESFGPILLQRPTRKHRARHRRPFASRGITCAASQ